VFGSRPLGCGPVRQFYTGGKISACCVVIIIIIIIAVVVVVVVIIIIISDV